MPYPSIADLPPALHRLPSHAQEIFRAAFNVAWQTDADQTPHALEATAFRVAWAAVKRAYVKRGEEWVAR